MKLEKYLKVEQSKSLSRQMPLLLYSTLVVSLITIAVLWGYFSKASIIFWGLSVFLLVICRWWATRDFTVDSTTESNAQHRLNVHTFWLVMYGLMMGSLAFLFHTPNISTYSVYLICVLVSSLSVNASSASIYLPAFFGFSGCQSMLFFLKYITGSYELSTILGLSIPVFFLVMVAVAHVSNLNFKDSKKLEYENARLVTEITEKNTIAENAIIEKNNFLAATSHDLRQPLHALGLYIDALEPRMKETVDIDVLRKIKDSKQALNDLLNGLLDISRLDANVVENRPKHLSLLNIATRLSAEFQVDLKASKIEFSYDVDDSHTVFVDLILTERVLRNLISNAFKYTNDGFIRLESYKKNNHIVIVLSDSGIGVPEDKIKQIFTEFTQLNNPERDRSKGLGLGLSIVRRICELQNIEYSFKSKVGEGSKVTLKLPMGDAALIPLTVNDTESSINNLTILFIDDEQAIRDGTALMIESWQCLPLIASDGKEALAKVLEYDDDIHLIISDLRLRDYENGIELVEKIREELNQEIPAIIVTGDTAVERIELATDYNVVLMHKPVQPIELRQQIEQLLEVTNGVTITH